MPPPLSPVWIRILLGDSLNEKPGVDKLRRHDLRLIAAAYLGRSGKDIKFMAQYMGNSEVKTSAGQIHYSDKWLKKGADILA